jgi:hypothetical protein
LRGNGCYAEFGPLALHWRNGLTLSWTEFLEAVADLPRRRPWRYGQAGDLPRGRDDKLALAKANDRRNVIAFTHDRDLDTLREMTDMGFHINLSADHLSEADSLADTGMSVATVLPSVYHKNKTESLTEYRNRLGGKLKQLTPAGRTIAICPATYSKTTCLDCQLCTRPRKNGVIIGFPAHGTGRRKIDEAYIT